MTADMWFITCQSRDKTISLIEFWLALALTLNPQWFQTRDWSPVSHVTDLSSFGWLIGSSLIGFQSNIKAQFLISSSLHVACQVGESTLNLLKKSCSQKDSIQVSVQLC